VLPMTPILIAVVETEIVAPALTHLAVAAAAMRDAAHPVALAPPQPLRSLPHLHHRPRPLMPRHKGKRLRPEPGKVPGDDVRVSAADEGGVDAAKHLVVARLRHRHGLDVEIANALENERIHLRRYGHLYESTVYSLQSTVYSLQSTVD